MSVINAYFSWRFRRQYRTLTAGDRPRTYYVHVPTKLDLRKPAPLVLALHGASMNGALMAWFCGLNEKADEAGFIVVYPDGIGSRSSYYWNAGNCCGEAVQSKVDDVAYIHALLNDLNSQFNVDSRQVFVTGMSNGAMMAYRLASEMSDRIAAIAPVAGTMGLEVCHPQRPVSVLHFHGTEDNFIPLNGGRGSSSTTGVHHHSVAHSIQAWVQADGCQAAPTVEKLSGSANDGLIATRSTFSGGRNGSEVVLVVIEGGGHTWPGRKPRTRALGRSMMAVSANDLMWDFFQKHPMCD
jgi:polyhydroxybutyrate depolymerase